MTVAVTRYRVDGLLNQPGARSLGLLILADLHACWPAMGPRRIAAIVAQANRLAPDIICLLGDYVGHILGNVPAAPGPVAAALSRLEAPMGVYCVFGNHDWRADKPAQRARAKTTAWHHAFAQAGLTGLSNRSVVVESRSGAFNLAGLDSQRAYDAPRILRKKSGPPPGDGADDLAAVSTTLDDALPTVLLAHEPDMFPDLPDSIGLTLSGHTHGGQVRPFGRAMVVPSKYGTRYAYGHFREGARQMIVSGGLGMSGLPIRYGMPPELTWVDLT